MRGSPEAVVAAQLAAYNARDIDGFMACWHPDAEMLVHPDTLLAKGHTEIRARHVVRFQEPDLYGRLVSRIALGDHVVDQEVVTRNMGAGKVEVDVVAIYDVSEGLIRRVWFLTGPPRAV